ncbi:MAG: hypothetical protein ALECFALPRED_002100 [Alectoria fallacina]|uniref:DUF6604 domain-containing protein n=1 Tax=Alectoria fallacina TaxID=1903189 RepID=A0A8H3IC07_9LECA|nr:MAG: hypothetical protein ALECFALPRED_002100 [Alectoria fallacina]
MLATTASQLSPSDTWRRMEEKTKERSTLGSWRERKVSKESGETRESGVKTVMSKLSGEMKDLSGSWRVRKREDVTRVYGEAMPAEWRLQQLYKQLKVNNNKFTTWVVESIYPCSESLPSYVTLSHEQAKDYSKYDIVVNNMTELARKTDKVPSTVLDLLQRLIAERSEYCHWMSRKSTDDLSRISTEKHLYYIEVLKEMKTILAERMEPQVETPTLTHNPTLGKRKPSATSLQGPDRRKAIKTTSSQQLRQETWRKVVSDTCDKMTDKQCAPMTKPTSYEAALRVTTFA